MVKTVFLTFGGGSDNFISACKRLTRQASRSWNFDHCYEFTDRDLKTDTDFWSTHGSWIEDNPKGYGYWIWKPYLINKVFNTLEDGDILLYLDAGCEIDKSCASEMPKYFNLVKSYNIIATSTHRPECLWTKFDLFYELDALNYAGSPQVQAGAIMFYVGEVTRNLVLNWYQIACDTNYHWIDNTPSVLPNFPNFEEHRHDQSIFSLLCKIYKIPVDKCSLHKCFHYKRNRSGIPTFLSNQGWWNLSVNMSPSK